MGTPLISGVNMYCSNVSALVYAHPPNIVTQHNFESALNLDNKTKPQQSSFAISGYSPIDLQAVYGVQSLIASGINGSGYNIGLLDFDGNPGVQEELSLFDNYVVGIPDPPNFQIVPIGNYNPNLGIVSGWRGEIDMDVESAHSMAPGANITLYIADSSLPLVAPLATIVQDHQVNIYPKVSLLQNLSIREVIALGLCLTLFYQISSTNWDHLWVSVFQHPQEMWVHLDIVGLRKEHPDIQQFRPLWLACGETTTYINENSDGSVANFEQTAW